MGKKTKNSKKTRSAHLLVHFGLRPGHQVVPVDQSVRRDDVSPRQRALLRELLLERASEPRAIFVVDEAILEHALRFVQPQAQKRLGVGHLFRVCAQDALDDLQGYGLLA